MNLGATPRVHRRLAQGLPPPVERAWDDLLCRLRRNPWCVPPDKRTVWSTAWPDIPNHRHADLPLAWRACWTVRNQNGPVVTLLFLGTHKEYDRLYGFSTS